ncbi:KRTAP12L1 [Ovibos moschatus]
MGTPHPEGPEDKGLSLGELLPQTTICDTSCPVSCQPACCVPSSCQEICYVPCQASWCVPVSCQLAVCVRVSCRPMCVLVSCQPTVCVAPACQPSRPALICRPSPVEPLPATDKSSRKSILCYLSRKASPCLINRILSTHLSAESVTDPHPIEVGHPPYFSYP